MARPRTDLHRKISEMLRHIDPMSPEAEVPLKHCFWSTTEAWNLRLYIERKIKATKCYEGVAADHMAALDRMILVNLIEALERFLKETAAVCVDHLANRVRDGRLDAFEKIAGSQLAAHFAEDTIGKSLCESGTWLDCNSINKRFRHLLADPFDRNKGNFYVFPSKNQAPEDERFRYATMGLLWQLRNTVVHNVGVITQSDATRLRLLVREAVEAPCVLRPTHEDLRYVKRFLDETADKINERVGRRLAELLTTLHDDDASLFEPQDTADEVSRHFGMELEIAGAVGSPEDQQ